MTEAISNHIAAQNEANPNLAAILSTSPQTLTTPVSYCLTNLIPFDQPVYVIFLQDFVKGQSLISCSASFGTARQLPSTQCFPCNACDHLWHEDRDSDSGPYRDEDGLLSLPLLAYLSKYPHVRHVFYKPRVTFHPASVNLPGARFGVGSTGPSGNSPSAAKQKEKATGAASSATSSLSMTKESFFRAFTSAATGVGSRGKERHAIFRADACHCGTRIWCTVLRETDKCFLAC